MYKCNWTVWQKGYNYRYLEMFSKMITYINGYVIACWILPAKLTSIVYLLNLCLLFHSTRNWSTLLSYVWKQPPQSNTNPLPCQPLVWGWKDTHQRLYLRVSLKPSKSLYRIILTALSLVSNSTSFQQMIRNYCGR